MKRYSQRSGHTAMAELNVTPLLDLAFVLLIIFIITTPLLENNIPLELPNGSKSTTPPLDPKAIHSVSIDRSGQIFLDSKPIDLPVLEQDLTAIKQDMPEAAVVIYADKSLRYQQVVDVFNVIQKAQIKTMSLKDTTP
jgi:biopolymer transport protein ExbD